MSDPPDVLFLVLDSVRRDRLPAYGHDRETTPRLDAFARRSTLYRNAFAPAPWTLPSHCSMFTGLFPSEHGVTNGFSDGMLRLPDDVTTLAERLAERGYRTAGFSNNPWVGRLSGLDRGFEEYVEWDLEIGRSDADTGVHSRRDRLASGAHRVLAQLARQPVFLVKRRFFTRRLVDRACRWFDVTDGEASPTFTFLNLMEAHSPYYPPTASFDQLGLEPPSLLEPRLLNTKLLAYITGRYSLSEPERERIMDYYDASLRFQDGQVGRLLDALEAQGRLEETLVVVCADHGKTLGDFDRDAVPPHYTRDVNVNVPLFVKRPGQTDGRVETDPFELSALHDLVVHGEDWSPRQSHTDSPTALVEDYLPHSGRTRPDELTRWRAVASTRYKYVRSEAGEEALFERGGGEELLVEDPDPTLLAQYRDELEARVRELGTPAAREGDPDPIDDAVRSQLHDLGYM